MRTIVGICLLAAVTAACGETSARAVEIGRLQAENDSLRQRIAELENTPDRRLASADAILQGGDTLAAEALYRELVRAFPGASEVPRAERTLVSIEAAREQARRDAERRSRLRFAVLEAKAAAPFDGGTLTRNTVAPSRIFVFDRYGTIEHVRQAEAGSVYVVADVSITAEGSAPRLPPVVAYRHAGERLERVGILTYRFHKWPSQAAYVGSVADTTNHFARSRTVRFSLGLEVSQQDAAGPLFVLAGRTGCVERVSEQFSRPTVAYHPRTCDPPAFLTVEEADRDWTPIGILNKAGLGS